MQTNALSRARLLAYIRSRTSIARRAIATDTTTYMHAPSVYTFAVIGYRLYRVQQPYGAQTRQLGMWVTYRNRALSNPIRFTALRSLRFTTAFLAPRYHRWIFGPIFFWVKGAPFSPSFLGSFFYLSARGLRRGYADYSTRIFGFLALTARPFPFIWVQLLFLNTWERRERES